MARQLINLQDHFLNQARRENIQVAIVMLDGTTISCQVRGFDNFTVVVLTETGAEHLLYKHAIAQLVAPRALVSNRPMANRDGRDDDEAPQQQAAPSEQREHQARGLRPERQDRGDRPDRRHHARGEHRRGEHRGGEGRRQQPAAPATEPKAETPGTPPAPATEQTSTEKPGSEKSGFNRIDLSSLKLD